MIISTKHLSRDLKIIGVLAFVFAVLYIRGIDVLIYFLNFLTFLSAGIVYFTLAAGVSRREKWAWFSGVGIFILSIIIALASLLFGLVSPFQIIIGLIIPVLFLITFIRAKQEITINKKRSVAPFILFVISFLLNLFSNIYLIYLFYLEIS